MNIKKKLAIVDILFSTMDGEEMTDADLQEAVASLTRNKVKRETYRRRMTEKYGEDVFRERATKAGNTRK